VGDRTGLEMIRTLQDHSIHQGIDVHMECTIVRLLTDGADRRGTGLRSRTRTVFGFRSKAVVLATGGIGRRTPSPATVGIHRRWPGLAYQAGAALQDLEFVQFHPTGMIWPPSVRGLLVTEGVRGEGGILLNSLGRRFMFDDIRRTIGPDRGQRG